MSLKYLVTILIHPRETMRRILENRDRWSWQVVMLAFICASVNDPDVYRAILPGLPLGSALAATALGMIVGGLGWILVLFILSWIAYGIGRLLEGSATVADVRAALAWGITPVIWSLIYRVPAGIAERQLHRAPRVDVHKVLVNFVAQGGCSIIILYLMMQLVFFIATIVIGSFTVAEAERFSTEKGFVTVASTIALPLMILFAAIFSFRS